MTSKTAPNLLTITPSDLSALADKLCGHDRVGLSKPAILNMIAATLLGPKHDWGRITASDAPVTSQRARAALGNADASQDVIPIAHVLRDAEDTGAGVGETKVSVKLQLNDILIETEDEQIVWIERNSRRLKVHIFNNTSDGPCSVRSMPGHRICMDAEAYDDAIYPEFVSAPSTDPKEGEGENEIE